MVPPAHHNLTLDTEHLIFDQEALRASAQFPRAFQIT